MNETPQSTPPTACLWLVERPRTITDEMVEAGWYPDFPTDTVEIVECGAPLAAGHESLCAVHAEAMGLSDREFEQALAEGVTWS